MVETKTTARIYGGPFDFAEGPSPPDAANWCFIAAGDRTGSNALARMLSVHPDCCIGEERGGPLALMAIFSSDYYAVIGDAGFVRRKTWAAADVRYLCDAWRQVYAGDATVAGDKQINIWTHRKAVREVFPGCQIIVTIRHPLDALSSLAACHWAHKLINGPDSRIIAYLHQRCQIFQQALADPTMAVVRYESLAVSEQRWPVVKQLWAELGLSISDKQLEQQICATNYDAPGTAIGRWKTDPFVKRIIATIRDEQLHEWLAIAGYGEAL